MVFLRRGSWEGESGLFSLIHMHTLSFLVLPHSNRPHTGRKAFPRCRPLNLEHLILQSHKKLISSLQFTQSWVFYEGHAVWHSLKCVGGEFRILWCHSWTESDVISYSLPCLQAMTAGSRCFIWLSQVLEWQREYLLGQGTKNGQILPIVPETQACESPYKHIFRGNNSSKIYTVNILLAPLTDEHTDAHQG